MIYQLIGIIIIDSVNEDGSFSYDIDSIENGVYTISLECTDIAGNGGIATVNNIVVATEDVENPWGFNLDAYGSPPDIYAVAGTAKVYNPDTDEDEQMREYINERIDLLKRHGKQSTLTDKVTPDIPKSKVISGYYLRSEYRSVDMDEISEIILRLGFKGRRSAESGDFKNQFEPMSVNGDDVVIDHAAGLMWHQAGSDEPLDFFIAQELIDDLNIQRYAGYSDRRLPTVEEAVSLFETKKMNKKMQINPVFSDIQRVTWTGDAYYPGRIWLALFSNSSLWEELKTNMVWVRPVRSLR